MFHVYHTDYLPIFTGSTRTDDNRIDNFKCCHKLSNEFCSTILLLLSSLISISNLQPVAKISVMYKNNLILSVCIREYKHFRVSQSSAFSSSGKYTFTQGYKIQTISFIVFVSLVVQLSLLFYSTNIICTGLINEMNSYFVRVLLSALYASVPKRKR